MYLVGVQGILVNFPSLLLEHSSSNCVAKLTSNFGSNSLSHGCENVLEFWDGVNFSSILLEPSSSSCVAKLTSNFWIKFSLSRGCENVLGFFCKFAQHSLP